MAKVDTRTQIPGLAGLAQPGIYTERDALKIVADYRQSGLSGDVFSHRAQDVIGALEFLGRPDITLTELTVKELLELLTDRNVQVVEAAIGALPKVPDPVIKEAVANVALREPEALNGLSVQGRALAYLRDVHGPEAVEECWNQLPEACRPKMAGVYLCVRGPT